uniref:Hydrolase ffsE n=1 Tax=Aspergillus flavipes TaxID=41900 RepID=FFSE_ASPFV|nr:RecName: Full=Hydrolase ffsE; AltName: Full=Cytochalasans biosynthesis cluster protein ffsE [Aspergillus flavipes]QOG08947.1 FfsE [Aspergillus flavipes]
MTGPPGNPAFATIHEFFPGNTFYNFECLRILSTAPYGGCDPAEFLTAIAAIKPSDPETWATAWSHAASQAERIAEDALARGDTLAARDAFLRASSYTRASGYMRINGPTLDRHDPRALPVARKTQALFRKALPFLDCDARIVDIPYRPTQYSKPVSLPGYVYIPSPQNRLPDGKIPVLLNTGGADSVQEELYYIHPQAGHARGYAVITFEGPGQGIVLREKGLYMRPDWEVVTGQVLDWLEGYAATLQQEEGLTLDLSRIAVVGASMGGYYALRAASDPRIKACLSIDPFYDMWDFGTRHISGLFMAAWTGGWVSDATIDRVIGAGMYLNFQLRWEVGVTTAFWGIESPSRILREMKRYSLQGGFLARVQCPVFVSGAGKSLYFDTEEHTMRVFGDLKHLGERRRTLWMPSRPEEGGLQAKIGAFGLVNTKAFGFLDGVFGVKRVLEAET